MSYIDLGFNENLSVANVGSQNQQLDPAQVEQMIPEMSASKLSGLVQSQDGRLQIDLDNNTIISSDGVIERMRFGVLADRTNGLLILDKNGNELMRIGDINFIQSSDGNSKLDFDNNRYTVSEGGITQVLLGKF